MKKILITIACVAMALSTAASDHITHSASIGYTYAPHGKGFSIGGSLILNRLYLGLLVEPGRIGESTKVITSHFGYRIPLKEVSVIPVVGLSAGGNGKLVGTKDKYDLQWREYTYSSYSKYIDLGMVIAIHPTKENRLPTPLSFGVTMRTAFLSIGF